MRRMQDREEWEMGYKGGDKWGDKWGDKGREEDFSILRGWNGLG